jgi:hypothetical protein
LKGAMRGDRTGGIKGRQEKEKGLERSST